MGLCGALEDEAFQQQQQQQQGCGGRKWDEDADVDETEEGEESVQAVRECRVMERCVWQGGFSVTILLLFLLFNSLLYIAVIYASHLVQYSPPSHSLVQWVLPRVGAGVSTLVVDVGQGITSRLLHQALLLCPNLTFLSAAHSSVDSYTFKG